MGVYPGDRATDDLPSDRPPHSVHFYEAERYPAPAIARYLADAIVAGGAALLVATRDNCLAIGDELAPLVDATLRDERLVTIDATTLLADLLTPERRIDRTRFDVLVRPCLTELTSRYRIVHAFGEMVDLLAQADNIDAAVELETAWERLLVEHRVELRCAYGMASFDGDPQTTALRRIVDAHTHVHTMDDDGGGAPVTEVELRQKGRLLRTALRQLERLQQITSAFSEAIDLHDVLHVVGRLLLPSAAADRAWMIATGSTTVWSIGRLSDGELTIGETPPQHPIAASLGTTQPVWSSLPIAGLDGVESLAILPVAARGTGYGTIVFAYDRARTFSSGERAFFVDLVNQLAVTLDRVSLFAQAQAAREHAEEAARTKDEFLAMLGHELRNPLSPIVTALELMSMHGDDTFKREREIINRQVSHLSRMVDDLLDISRITSGKIELRAGPLDAADAIHLAIEQVSPLLESRRHHLRVAVDRGLDVVADGGRLAQVVTNLLNNAARYTPEGGVIAISARRIDGEIAIIVSDNGNGISADLLPRIFDQFVQGERGRDRSEGGLGLGLAIVRTLVAMHGGRVSAQSAGLGQGSEFTIRLPASSSADRPLLRRDATAPTGRRPLRILLVDDNQDAAELLAMVLRRAGHTVFIANDGPAGLAAAHDVLPDACILDIGLPVMDGYELARHIKALHVDSPQLIALSGYGKSEDLARSAEVGFHRHFVKPVDSRQLLATLDELTAPATPSS